MLRIAPRDGRHRDRRPIADELQRFWCGAGFAMPVRMAQRSLLLLCSILVSACGSEALSSPAVEADTGTLVVDSGTAMANEETSIAIEDSGSPDTMEPAVDSATAMEADAPTTAATLPAEFLDLKNWKL